MIGVKCYVPDIDSTYREAIESLRLCCSSSGLKASGKPKGHHQIWARDSMIALIGARFSQDTRIQQALLDSLSILKARRGPHGAAMDGGKCVGQRDAVFQ